MDVRYSIDFNLLQSIADAIRLKTDDTSLIAVKDFPEKIMGIITGTITEITSEIDELGNVTSYGLVGVYDDDNDNLSVHGFNSFVWENGHAIIK